MSFFSFGEKPQLTVTVEIGIVASYEFSKTQKFNSFSLNVSIQVHHQSHK